MSDTNSFPYTPSDQRVTLTRGEWVDSKRNGRSVPYKLYMPDDGADLPLIIWSHGLGGTRDGAGFLARFITAQGYAHLHIQHDGSDDSLWRNQPELHPWDAIRKNTPLPWDVVKNRYLDVPFVVEQLRAGNALSRDITTRIDLTHMGLCGHSFGALTTQICAGQWTGENDDTAQQLICDGFTAGILYSPVPNFRLKMPAEALYGDFKIPLLFMTGTKDDSPVEGFGHQERMDIFTHANDAMHQLMVMNGADHMVFNGSRGQLKSYEGMEEHKRQICESSLAWWNAHLKQDDHAMNWLKNGGIERLVG